jgi:hypothetical protein
MLPVVPTKVMIMIKKISKRSDIPSANAPRALSIYDGQNFAGRIVPQDGDYFAFRTDNTLLGVFPTQREAMCALPVAKVSS